MHEFPVLDLVFYFPSLLLAIMRILDFIDSEIYPFSALKINSAGIGTLTLLLNY